MITATFPCHIPPIPNSAVERVVRDLRAARQLINEGQIARIAAQNAAQELFESGFKMHPAEAVDLWKLMADFWPPANKEINKIFGVDE
jgi:hypothetical protein